MSNLEAALQRIASDLAEAGVLFALVGGLAVSIRTEPRFTRDADLVVALEGDPQAEALIFRLRGLGYSVNALVEQEAVGRLATARLNAPGSASAMEVDLLFASSGIEVEIVSKAELIEILPGISSPVARTGHLIALKVLSRDDENRPQDLVDLRALLKAASTEEISLARDALTLIGERGYHRGRDLMGALISLLATR